MAALNSLPNADISIAKGTEPESDRLADVKHAELHARESAEQSLTVENAELYRKAQQLVNEALPPEVVKTISSEIKNDIQMGIVPFEQTAFASEPIDRPLIEELPFSGLDDPVESLTPEQALLAAMFANELDTPRLTVEDVLHQNVVTEKIVVEADLADETLELAGFVTELRKLAEQQIMTPDIELGPQTIIINEEVAKALEGLELHKDIAMAEGILIEIMSASVLFNKMFKAGNEAGLDRAKQDLQDMCVELFEFLKLDYTEETVEKFIQSMIFMQKIRADQLKSQVSNQASEEGTHERKLDVDSSDDFDWDTAWELLLSKLLGELGVKGSLTAV